MYCRDERSSTHSSITLVFIPLVASRLGAGHTRQNGIRTSAKTVRHSTPYIIPYMFLRSRNRTLLLENWCHAFRENRESDFIIIVRFMMSANSWVRFGLNIVFVYLYITPSHYHHCASRCEGIELMKMPVIYICRVCKIEHILSVTHYTICGAVCFQFTHFLVMTERIYILVLLSSSKVWTITQCLGMRCMSFYILINSLVEHRSIPSGLAMEIPIIAVFLWLNGKIVQLIMRWWNITKKRGVPVDYIWNITSPNDTDSTIFLMTPSSPCLCEHEHLSNEHAVNWLAAFRDVVHDVLFTPFMEDSRTHQSFHRVSCSWNMLQVANMT